MIEGVSAKIRGGWSLWSCVASGVYGTVWCESSTGGGESAYYLGGLAPERTVHVRRGMAVCPSALLQDFN